VFDLGPSYVPPPPPMEGGGLYLRPPLYSDFPTWAALRSASRSFLEPWEPSWESDMLTRAGYRARLRQFAREWREDRGYSFHIFSVADARLVGGINVSGVRRRAAQFASLGYWMGEAYSGKGLMSVALSLLLPRLFQDFRLHRVEAACIPENEPSRKVLEKFGFRQVGFSRGYLRINGAWRDHLLYELQLDDLNASRAMAKPGGVAPRLRDVRA
jgi:[ribosomal protein S5]-alanine N-acetyltransferase